MPSSSEGAPLVPSGGVGITLDRSLKACIYVDPVAIQSILDR
jgi:hypothetical protein